MIAVAFALLWLTTSALADPPNYKTNTQLPAHQKAASVEHIDLWGEGRVEWECGTPSKKRTCISGFKDSYNLNTVGKTVMMGSVDDGKDIPNHIPVTSWENGLEDKVGAKTVKYFSVMNAPIDEIMADHIAASLQDNGMVLLYGSDEAFAQRVQRALEQKARFVSAALYGTVEELPTTLPAKFKEPKMGGPYAKKHVWVVAAR
jgi:hypothetical protein